MKKAIQVLFLFLALLSFSACNRGPSVVNQPETTSNSDTTTVEVAASNSNAFDSSIGDGPIEMAAYELRADSLLAATLSEEQLKEGWVRLFDGQTLAGWSMMGQADWQVNDGILRVTCGEKSFLFTNFDIADFELKVDFRAAPNTNSGVFIRSVPKPSDPNLDCLEINIAPPENPFPTGSVVARQKVEPVAIGSDFDPTQWHTFWVRAEGDRVTIQLDDKKVLELVDEVSSRPGVISLQYNEGVVEFRNVLMRPLDRYPLKMGSDWQDDWATAEKEPDTLNVESTDAGLHIRGGLGKVQSLDSFGDFILQAAYTLAAPEVNSGIFFRCIEDSMLDGYECQVNHAIVEGNPLQPKDGGAGAIFRRRDARIVVGDGKQPTYLTLLASGNQFVTWVNGLMTAEFYDDRPADENPRKGSRLDAGPIALQGHDPGTDVVFHEILVTDLR